MKEISKSLRMREDEFSWQVSSAKDKGFWFRLEKRKDGTDIITDFFPGGFKDALGGALLAECYRSIERVPADRIVFKDIVSSHSARSNQGAAAVLAISRYANFGREMMSIFGKHFIELRTTELRGRYDLELIHSENRTAGAVM